MILRASRGSMRLLISASNSNRLLAHRTRLASSSSSPPPPNTSSSAPASKRETPQETTSDTEASRDGLPRIEHEGSRKSSDSPLAFLDQLRRTIRARIAGSAGGGSGSGEEGGSLRAHITPALRQKLTDASQRWNVLSGYDEVLRKTLLVDETEEQLKEIRKRQKEVRQEYVDAVARRSASQRRINDLLQRKSAWTDEDLSAYTALLRAEHGEGRAEAESQAAYDAVEQEVGRKWDAVQRTTLERYHAEQVWRDRVREASTYGSIVVAIVNVVVFVSAILFVEPLKRKRLARTFEERLVQVEEEHTRLVKGLVAEMAGDVGGQMHGIEDRLSMLMQRAGVQLPDDSTATSEEEAGPPSVALQPSASSSDQSHPPPSSSPPPPPSSTVSPPSSERAQTHRKDMALAGGLGFALGAGILAAMGAVWS